MDQVIGAERDAVGAHHQHQRHPRLRGAQADGERDVAPRRPLDERQRRRAVAPAAAVRQVGQARQDDRRFARIARSPSPCRCCRAAAARCPRSAGRRSSISLLRAHDRSEDLLRRNGKPVGAMHADDFARRRRRGARPRAGSVPCSSRRRRSARTRPASARTAASGNGHSVERLEQSGLHALRTGQRDRVRRRARRAAIGDHARPRRRRARPRPIPGCRRDSRRAWNSCAATSARPPRDPRSEIRARRAGVR